MRAIIFSKLKPMCTAGLIWYTLKVLIWNPKNIQDEIDMLIWVNLELLTWNYIHVMQIISFLIYKTKLGHTCTRSIYWKSIFDTYILFRMRVFGILSHYHFHEILTWISLHVWSGFFGSTSVVQGFDIWNYKNCLGQPSFSLDLACSQAIIKQVFVNECGIIIIHGSAKKNPKKHWGWDKPAAIWQTALSNAFHLMKMYEFCLTFHWSLILRSKLTILQHWFR